MTPEEKRRIIRQKLEAFLSLPPEEKLAIDEDPRNDGLFNTLQEMSDIVASCQEAPAPRTPAASRPPVGRPEHPATGWKPCGATKPDSTVSV